MPKELLVPLLCSRKCLSGHILAVPGIEKSVGLMPANLRFPAKLVFSGNKRANCLHSWPLVLKITLKAGGFSDLLASVSVWSERSLLNEARGSASQVQSFAQEFSRASARAGVDAQLLDLTFFPDCFTRAEGVPSWVGQHNVLEESQPFAEHSLNQR